AHPRFRASGELLRRGSLNRPTVEPTYRYALLMTYTVAPNRMVSFTLGKSFDERGPQTGGNLIAALNLVLGFGAERPF
ncbi:MAG: hypothetical protein WBA12_06910, partial [Catalinimonas sp.]